MAIAISGDARYQELDAYRSEVSLTADRSTLPTTLSDAKDQARYISIWVCACLKRHPRYTTPEDTINIQAILGDRISNEVDRFIEMYSQGDDGSRDGAWL